MDKSVLDHPLVSKRYFFPRKKAFDKPFWVDCGDAKLGCYYLRNHPGSKTFIHFHGSGEIVADNTEQFAPIIDSMGYNCFLSEYRGYGMSDGVPSLVKMMADVEQIILAIGEKPENLILFGRSLGSVYAIHAAYLFPEIAALIIESGIANPMQRLLNRIRPQEIDSTKEQIKAAVAADINHKKKLAVYKNPMLIMHTQHDGLTDVSHARHLYEWTSGPKTLKIFEHGDHNSILFLNFHEYFEVIRNFLAAI